MPSPTSRTPHVLFVCQKNGGKSQMAAALLRDLAGQIWRTAYPGMISASQIEYMLGWMYSAGKIAAAAYASASVGVLPKAYVACSPFAPSASSSAALYRAAP